MLALTTTTYASTINLHIRLLEVPMSLYLGVSIQHASCGLRSQGVQVSQVGDVPEHWCYPCHLTPHSLLLHGPLTNTIALFLSLSLSLPSCAYRVSYKGQIILNINQSIFEFLCKIFYLSVLKHYQPASIYSTFQFCP